MTSGTVTVVGHTLVIAQLGSDGDFDTTQPDDEAGLYVITSRSRDAFAVSTLVADGRVLIETSDQKPSSGAWSEHATVELDVAGPILALQMVDEEELEPLFIPDRPGLHTISIYGDRRAGQPERYLLVFIANS